MMKGGAMEVIPPGPVGVISAVVVVSVQKKAWETDPQAMGRSPGDGGQRTWFWGGGRGGWLGGEIGEGGRRRTNDGWLACKPLIPAKPRRGL
ncbi:hypothetical protein ACOMHN_010947 [Nucella lapillus]